MTLQIAEWKRVRARSLARQWRVR